MANADVELSSPTIPIPPARTLPSNAEDDQSAAGSWRYLLNDNAKIDALVMKTNHKPTSDTDYPPWSSVFLKKLGAEVIGTFILIFASAGSAIINEKNPGTVSFLGVFAAPGLAVMIVILSTGHISGAHLNPSVTIAFATFKHFLWIQVPFYIACQVVGSIVASFALKLIFHPDHHGGVTVPAGTAWQSFALEIIVSFILMFVVTAVATDTRAIGELAGLAVGATVTVNNLIAGVTSGCSMNPVRTLGPAIAVNNYKALWVYMIGPTLGTLAGAGAYTFVRIRDEGGIEGRVSSFRR